MNSKELKKNFDEIARANNFEKAFGGWFKEEKECLVVLDLQKSNFENHYYINIKIYVQGIFGRHYVKDKHLVKKETGDIFIRQPKKFNDILSPEVFMDVELRKQGLVNLFDEFLIPFSKKALSRSGLMELEKQEKVYLLPAVRAELKKLG